MEVAKVIEIFDSGTFDALEGVVEDGRIDFKGQPYDLSSEYGKFELAKDVAAFANGSHDAIIVVGVETEQPTNSPFEIAKACAAYSSRSPVGAAVQAGHSRPLLPGSARFHGACAPGEGKFRARPLLDMGSCTARRRSAVSRPPPDRAKHRQYPPIFLRKFKSSCWDCLFRCSALRVASASAVRSHLSVAARTGFPCR